MSTRENTPTDTNTEADTMNDTELMNAAATFAARHNATMEYATAIVAKADTWVPAAAGHEEPTTYRDGRRLLYCFNPATGEHRYLNLGNDTIEEIAVFGTDLVACYITGEPAATPTNSIY